MYHSPKWFHLTKNLESSLLADEQLQLLSSPLKIKDKDNLCNIMSLQSINNRICKFRSGLQMLRWIIFIPWFLGLIVSFTWFSTNFYDNWISEENRIISEIEYINNTKYPVTNSWGEVFEQKYGNDRKKELIKYIGNDMTMSLMEYIEYTLKVYLYGKEDLIVNFSMLIFYLSSIPLCFYAAFLSKQKAPLTLIRDRQLFITWINGKAFVARYSQVGVVETHQAVSLILYGLNKDKRIIRTAFVLPTNPTFIMSSSQGRKDLLAFIAKYMVWGLSAVASTEYERNMPYYLRKDKKPDDFEQQVDEILAVLDKLDSPRELNTLTHIKGK
ncbi:hypothetical protein A6V27_08100 [Hafnia alvei]|uniref:hypothetical protein n=1 Tax=Hafnia alvei TaxID=569 RepID=UPI0007BC9102|nr:hypothetical protein [Hafnia alvei]ANC40317.1 hypothetical protein A6V27_08100 [Hafnia alvei]